MKMIKKSLNRLVRHQPGPLPSFTKTQLLDLILVIGRTGVVGRKRLSKILGVGEGVVRTMLSRLRDEGLIEVAGREGCRLTPKGKRIYGELSKMLKEIGPLKITLPWNYRYNHVVVVKNRAESVRKGLEQRDEAIRAGAGAAIILTYRDHRLLMPEVSDLTSERPDFASRLIKLLRPENNDVIIIAAADDPHDARYGALAAAETLL